MAVRLFNLRNVPDDEAQEIREILDKHHIDFYETPAGNWGMSMPSLWLRNEDQLQRARVLIDEYQKERVQKARDEYQRLKADGRLPTIREKILEHPARFIFYVFLISFFLYISISPFINLGE